MKIMWYVSSHGWGHAARQRELINRYTKRHPSAEISLSSEVPRWFWKGTAISDLCNGAPAPSIHDNGWKLDLKKTEIDLMNFMDVLDDSLQREVEHQRSIRPDLVVSDIDPLPLAAASESGTGALAVGNFTWDWIFSRLFPHRHKEAAVLKRLYRDAVYLRLPLGPNHSPCRRTVDVPLLRAGGTGRGKIPEDLLPGGTKCLFALRSLPKGINANLPKGCTAFSSLPNPLSRRIVNITPKVLLQRDLAFADLMAACDVVVSKAGYGIVSQILSMGKPCVIFAGRGFPEEPFLVEPLRKRPSTKVLPADETEDLSAAVEGVLSGSEPEKVEADGCEFILGGGYLTSSRSE